MQIASGGREEVWRGARKGGKIPTSSIDLTRRLDSTSPSTWHTHSFHVVHAQYIR